VPSKRQRHHRNGHDRAKINRHAARLDGAGDRVTGLHGLYPTRRESLRTRKTHRALAVGLRRERSVERCSEGSYEAVKPQSKVLSLFVHRGFSLFYATI